jgi:ubiquinone/menaquinone biosynthesis C-methylase UbiE
MEIHMPDEPTLAEASGGDPTFTYPLGYTDHEFARLEQQGAIFREFTSDVLRRAGLAPGMRVLDIGCGVGDVSLLAAELVGPYGTVIGVDRSAESVAVAIRRVTAAGHAPQIELVVDELDDFVSTGQGAAPFDAVIGRFVLMYQPDPVGILRRLAGMVRAGGTVALLEMVFPMFRSVPEVPLFTLSARRIMTTVARAGAEVDMGSRLTNVFVEAGLPMPTAALGGYTGGGPDSPVYAYVADSVRSLAPIAERLGIFTAAEADVDTLAERLATETTSLKACLMPPPLVGAWTRRD